MANLRLSTVGAICAVVATAGFVLGIVLTASSGVQVIIPDSGTELEWLADAQDGGDLFIAGTWIVVFAGLIGLIGLVGFYDALGHAGPVMIVAPVAGAVGLTLVTISHAIPITLAQEIVPAYMSGDAATKSAAVVDAQTLTSIAHLTNYFGDALGWGVAVPLYAIAILKTGALPKWIGWVGMVAAVFAGWIGLFSPLSSVIDGLTFPGFLAFFVFMGSVGVALLRRRKELPAASLAPV
jgi:hypothetical protein